MGAWQLRRYYVQQAERGVLGSKEEVEAAGREIRETFLYREVMKAREGSYESEGAPLWTPPWLVGADEATVTHADKTFVLAKKFHLAVRDARHLWVALDPNLPEAGVGIAIVPILTPPPVHLWKSPSGEIKMTIPPGTDIPADLSKEIREFRASEDTHRLSCERPAPANTHLQWLWYGPDRPRLAERLYKSTRAVGKDLDRYREGWQGEYGGTDVPRLWLAISTFHQPISADTDKITLNLTV